MGRKGLKTAFDRLQLYKSRPELYPLWVLHRLDIIDKHKTLLTTTMPLQPVLESAGRFLDLPRMTLDLLMTAQTTSSASVSLSGRTVQWRGCQAVHRDRGPGR